MDRDLRPESAGVTLKTSPTAEEMKELLKNNEMELVDPFEPEKELEDEFDNVHRPKHYNSHPSGIQCIEITEHMGFNIGNVIKYAWRSDLKNGIEDLEKARWYLDREIKKRKK